MNMHRLSALGLLALAACTGADPDSWSTPADCEGLSDADVRDDCYSRVSVPVFKEDREAGLAMLEAVSDPLIRDYILLKITREVDPTSFQYCNEIRDERLKDRCEVLVRRPHLHRDLQEPGGAQGPGGPPPGGPAGGGKAPGGGPGGPGAGAPPSGGPPPEAPK